MGMYCEGTVLLMWNLSAVAERSNSASMKCSVYQERDRIVQSYCFGGIGPDGERRVSGVIGHRT